MVKHRVGLLGLGLLAVAAVSGVCRADCLSLVRGAAVIDAENCIEVAPEKRFAPNEAKYKWIYDLDPAGKKKFMDSYRGVAIRAKVLRSKATRAGLNPEGGALANETVMVFVPPGQGNCLQLGGKLLAGEFEEVCCDGGGRAPCLVGTTYRFNVIKDLGPGTSTSAGAARKKANRSKAYQEAESLRARGQAKSALALYLQAYSRGELDVTGKLHLAQTYRSLDDCPHALKPLKEIYTEQTQGRVWADDERDARAAVFLLARCYARLNDPDNATMVLNSYLLEPSKYREELKESLDHPDFGWIKTSKAYLDYKKAALEKLRKTSR